MTFSIAGRCTRTGMLGAVVTTSSMGVGSRCPWARAGVGTQDIRITIYRDGAENWFIEGDSTVRVRLVMELSVPRAAFGGDFGNPTRAELQAVPPLPETRHPSRSGATAKRYRSTRQSAMRRRSPPPTAVRANRHRPDWAYP